MEFTFWEENRHLWIYKHIHRDLCTHAPRGNCFSELVQKAWKIGNMGRLVFGEQSLGKSSEVLTEQGPHRHEAVSYTAITRKLFQWEGMLGKYEMWEAKAACLLMSTRMKKVGPRQKEKKLPFATVKNNKERTIHSGKN